jgi:Zn-dependent protease/predicted transcriptional regulator
MKSGFRIGRVFGINIDIDWSWVLIFILVSWNLSIAFSASHREWGTGMHWVLAVAAALIFFISVLAHEIAHSLMARYRGVPVKSITLFLFGGVSNIQREPPSPMAEFLITIVGPLTSFIIGIFFLFLGALTTSESTVLLTDPAAALAQFSPLTTILLWLGSVNIMVGFFNLIPGFPLDGGRVLRSILWAVTGNLRRATRWASFVGQGIAWLMILAGIAMFFDIRVPFLGTGFASGIWLVFIGWFLNSAAVQSYRQLVLQDILEDVEVGRLMRTHPVTITPDISVDKLVNEHFLGSGSDAFPVVSGDEIVGMVTLDDARKLPREEWQDRSVADIMTPFAQLPVLAPHDDASEALNMLRSSEVKQLLVMRGRELLGILDQRDLVRWLQIQSEGVKI